MKRISFFLIHFVLLSFHLPTPNREYINIVWNEKELHYIIEKFKRENLKRKERKNKSSIKKEYVIITAYTPSVWETDSTPFITASGKRISKYYVAVSRDLLSKFPYGTKVKITIPDKNLPGCGSRGVIRKKVLVRQVEDTMNKRYSKRIDLVFFSRKEAIKFGKCKGVIIAEDF